MIQYRKAILTDIIAIANLRAISWGTVVYWTDRISTYMDGSRNPQHALAPRVLYVACDDEQVVGVIAGHLTQRYQCDGELEWIDVLPLCQRQGIAQALIKLLAAWFAAQNAFKVCVNVDPANTKAKAFYARTGALVLNEHWMVWNNINAV